LTLTHPELRPLSHCVFINGRDWTRKEILSHWEGGLK